MKRLFFLLLSGILSFASISLYACKDEAYNDVSCQQVVSCYEATGYDVWHKDMEGEYGYLCCVKASEKDNPSNYIYFTFFATEEEAELYVSEHKRGVLIYLFACYLGENAYSTLKNYGKIVVEYDNKSLLKPFKSLIE